MRKDFYVNWTYLSFLILFSQYPVGFSTLFLQAAGRVIKPNLSSPLLIYLTVYKQ